MVSRMTDSTHPLYASAEPPLDRIKERLAHVKQLHAVSHATAWMLHGLPLPKELYTPTICISVATSWPRSRIKGIKTFRRNNSLEVINHRDFIITSPRQTFLDLAMLSPSRDLLVACGDIFVGNDEHKLHDLKTFVANAHNVNGLPLARKALDLVRVGAESIMESKARVQLLDAGLPDPQVNLNVNDSNGEFVARVDLAYELERVAIEYEGRHHALDSEQFEKDVYRIRQLGDIGWTVIRITAKDVADPRREWIKTVQNALQRRELRKKH